LFPEEREMKKKYKGKPRRRWKKIKDSKSVGICVPWVTCTQNDFSCWCAFVSHWRDINKFAQLCLFSNSGWSRL